MTHDDLFQRTSWRSDIMTDKVETPDWLMRMIEIAWEPTLDPCPIDYKEGDPSGLNMDWNFQIVYCNPPYSDILPWVEKATSVLVGRVILLLPVRTATSWWEMIQEYEIIYLPRFRFKGHKYNHRESMCLVII